jgi:hypothetical protein
VTFSLDGVSLSDRRAFSKRGHAQPKKRGAPFNGLAVRPLLYFTATRRTSSSQTAHSMMIWPRGFSTGRLSLGRGMKLTIDKEVRDCLTELSQPDAIAQSDYETHVQAEQNKAADSENDDRTSSAKRETP